MKIGFVSSRSILSEDRKREIDIAIEKYFEKKQRFLSFNQHSNSAKFFFYGRGINNDQAIY